MGVMTRDYMLEKRLMMLDPELHRRFQDTVFAMQNILFRFRQLFPEFTDHSALHSMTVIDFCNRLIGPEQIEKLNADTIYVLLVGCYLHDVGMGISEEQFREFGKEIDFGDYYEKHPGADMGRIIRAFHHEFSAAFIRKFAEFLEIPTPKHECAVIQVCRGHRVVDLFDRTEFPLHFTVPNGNEINLPYLAALIRLADEIDVAADRNPLMLYDMESFADEHEIAYHKRHQSVQELVITEDALTLLVRYVDPDTDQMVRTMVQKMEQTLQNCREAAQAGSPFRISQSKILIQDITG